MAKQSEFIGYRNCPYYGWHPVHIETYRTKRHGEPVTAWRFSVYVGLRSDANRNVNPDVLKRRFAYLVDKAPHLNSYRAPLASR